MGSSALEVGLYSDLCKVKSSEVPVWQFQWRDQLMSLISTSALCVSVVLGQPKGQTPAAHQHSLVLVIKSARQQGPTMGLLLVLNKGAEPVL